MVAIFIGKRVKEESEHNAIWLVIEAALFPLQLTFIKGAKNHAVIMPDAAKDTALNALVGAAFGASGQRCMAISVGVFVSNHSRRE